MATKTKTKTKAAASPTARSPSNASSRAFSSWQVLFVALPAAIAALGGVWRSNSYFNDHLPRVDPRAVNGTPPLMNASMAARKFQAWVGDKHASELVDLTTPKLLVPAEDGRECPSFKVEGDLTHISDVMGGSVPENQVFLMLNGQNEGLFVPWEPNNECLFELARFAAEQLGADVDLIPNGLKLFSQDGLPITTSTQLSELKIAHVLLDGQFWVWPGIVVGYKRDIEGFNVTTQSLSPRVFTIEGFFSQEEADAVISEGVGLLSRSPVDSVDAVNGYHSDRTSFTTFLEDSQFTRDLRTRTARVLRLPAPGFVERLQLVRYEVGQFFRKHEDYFHSKEFLPPNQLSGQEYEAWTKWASAQIEALDGQAAQDLPVEFRKGGAMFPDFKDTTTFQQALLTAFMDDAKAVNFFEEHTDVEWGSWIAQNLEIKANDIIDPLMKSKGYMLPYIIESWEKRAGNIPQLKYSIPKRPVNGVTHYFRWIRWAKERIQDVLDTNPSLVPDAVAPTGPDYPTYYMSFQNRLVSMILADNSKDKLVAQFNAEWYDWFTANRDNNDVLIEALRTRTDVLDLIVAAWTKRAGDATFAYTKPKHLHHIEPNRFATLFLYLNDCLEGGETVFPYSKERLLTNIKRDGMAECSDGLAIPPIKLTTSMFYSQTPTNDLDPASLHGGCPPSKGVKCK